MSICQFCGENAGWFRSEHPNCRETYEHGNTKIPQSVYDGILSGRDMSQVMREVDAIAAYSFLARDDAYPELKSDGWDRAFDYYLSDGILTPQEQARLIEAARLLGLDEDTLKALHVPEKVAMSQCLANIMQGNLVLWQGYQPNLPFVFQKSEALVWVFDSVPYYEEKTYRERISSSSGFSTRVGKGSYMRVSGGRSYTVEHTGMEHMDTGTLALTTKHVLFAGSRKSLRVPYSKVVSFQPFTDGFGLVKDNLTARPQHFLTGNGWFAFNLAHNLAYRAV